jgi:hypothetical protein
MISLELGSLTWKVFLIIEKMDKNCPIEKWIKTEQSVPPMTIHIDGTWIKAMAPPPIIMDPIIIPLPTSSPIIVAMSICYFPTET